MGPPRRLAGPDRPTDAPKPKTGPESLISGICRPFRIIRQVCHLSWH